MLFTQGFSSQRLSNTPRSTAAIHQSLDSAGTRQFCSLNFVRPLLCVYQKTSSYGRGNKIKRGGNDIHRKQNKIMTIMIIKRDKKREKAVLNPLFYKSPEVSARKIIYFFCQGSVSCTISWPPLPTASRMAASAAL